MLNDFRKFSGNIVTKALLTLLVLSFVLWGVGDMVRMGASQRDVARVGDATISVESYRRELAFETEQVRRSLGASYSTELLRRLNVPQFVLRRMVQQLLLRQEAERMGFIPDDTIVALEIRSNPAYLNNAGSFDKARFENALRGQGISEAAYVEQLRMEIATRRLLDSLAVSLPMDKEAFSQLESSLNQGRDVTIYKLAAEALPALEAPSEDDLEVFYKEQAARFTRPEYRTVSFARFASDPAHATATTEKVNALEDMLAGGATLKEAVDKVGLKVEQAGTFNKNGENPKGEIDENIPMLDRFIETAFQTDEQTESSVMSTASSEGYNGYYVLRVESITPQFLPPLESVRKEVEKAFAERQLERQLADRVSQLENDLAAAKQSTDIIRDYKLAKTASGKLYRDDLVLGAVPIPMGLVNAAFQVPVGKITSPAKDKRGYYLMMHVNGITPAKSSAKVTGDRLKNEVMRTMQDEMMSQYLYNLERQMPVEIHKPVLDQILKIDDAES